MNEANKRKIFFLLKTVIYTSGLLSLILVSKFWIGSEESWNTMVKNEFIPALITRTVFGGVTGLFFLGLSFWIHCRYQKKSAFSKELFVLLLFSLCLNLIGMLRIA